MEIYRWDLDKTYIQTDFDSIRGLMRSAMEAPEDKRNVPGSGSLLRALSRRPEARVIILSGSPTQMREVLTQKLQLDGIRFEELHLKDNLGNIKRGRFRAVKGQMGYKLPALFEGRVGGQAADTETLFGDDAEVDAIVYSVFADALAGRLSKEQVKAIMESGGAYPDQVEKGLAALAKLETSDAVGRIFIHLERRMPPSRFEPLGTRVVPVYSWYQAALVLFDAGQLEALDVAAVTSEVCGVGLSDFALQNLTQDIVRRGALRPSTMARLVDELPELQVRTSLARASARVARLADGDRYREPAPPDEVDYSTLLKHFGRKVSQSDPRS